MHRNTILTIVTLLSVAFGAQAKTQKPLPIACLNIDKVMEHMPELPKVQNDLRIYEGQLEKQLQTRQSKINAKQKILKQKSEAYNKAKNHTATGKSKKGAKQGDTLEKMESEIQALYQEMYQLSMALDQLKNINQRKAYDKKQALFEPLYKKILDAAEEIAKRRGYGGVQPAQLFLYVSEDIDITKAVAKELGFNIKPKAPKVGKKKALKTGKNKKPNKK